MKFKRYLLISKESFISFCKSFIPMDLAKQENLEIVESEYTDELTYVMRSIVASYYAGHCICLIAGDLDQHTLNSLKKMGFTFGPPTNGVLGALYTIMWDKRYLKLPTQFKKLT